MWNGYPYPNNQIQIQELQNLRDRIDSQMRQMQQPANNQQPTAINQTFQLAPNQNNLNDLEAKIVKDIDDVKNTLVIKTGIFIDKDYSTLWIKDVSGNIRTFQTNEVIELDEKDKKILALQKQIEEMKGMMLNAKSDNTDVNGSATSKKSSRISNAKSNDE